MEGRNNLGRRDNGWQHDRHHGGDGGRDDRPYHSRNREIDRDRGHYGAPSSRHRDDRPPRDFSRRDRSRSREREPRGHGDNHRGSYRGESRDSDRGYGGRRGDSNRDDQDYPRMNEVSATVIIKDLPAHTMEPALYGALAAFSPQNIRLITSRDTGECKGFAFVEFYSPEYAEYFMKAYAGSWGDSSAPQLIIENRAVTLDYARDNQRGYTGPIAGNSERDHSRAPRTDWLCDACGCQNFARRNECYKCSRAKGDNATTLSSITHGEPMVDPTVATETPSSTLVAKGLPPLATEEQIAEMFRQYALVSNVLIMRDWATNISRGIAFVEFHGVEHATHVKNQTGDLKIGNHLIKVGYARPGYLNYFQKQTTAATTGNPYAMAAMQAAQWSSNNVYQPPAASRAPPAVANATAAGAVAGSTSKSWPPNFDTAGAAYHFQPQSGCFLDPVSQYYYCPRSKTYYNAVSGEYFRHVGGTDPDNTFKKVLIPEPSANDTASGSPSSSVPSSGTLPKGKRKPVSMNLGSVKLKAKTPPVVTAVIESKSQPAADSVPATLLTSTNSSAFAKMSEDVMKWQERMREERESEALSVTPPSSSSPGIVSSDVAGVQTQPICLLCRRQFPSVEVLRRHERESNLHAQNVAKAKAEGAKYRDRASERRELHPAEEVKAEDLPPEPVRNANIMSSKTPIDAVPVSVDKDDMNPGNALLRQMGWKEGKGLGKEGEGKVAPVALDAKVSGSSLAPGEKTGVGASDRVSNLAYGDAREYKESLYRAKKARFDSVVAKEGKPSG